MKLYLIGFLLLASSFLSAQSAAGKSPKGELIPHKQNVVTKTVEKQETENKVFPEPPVLIPDISEGIPKASEEKPNAVAVIIGNKDYTKPRVPQVEFAVNDAALVKNYVVSALGYKPENIIYAENATQADLFRIFGTENNYQGDLYDYLRKGLSDIFIYYSGHGAPDPNSKQGYIVPVDCDPNKVSLNGYSLKTLYSNLDKIAKEKLPGQITVVLDACFSGASEKGSLLTNISPIYITVESQAIIYPRTSLFTSSSGDQVSNWYRDKKQSLFTYFFLRGLKGEADKNSDHIITSLELSNYISDEINGVPYWSRRLNGRTQTPTFSGNDFPIYK